MNGRLDTCHASNQGGGGAKVLEEKRVSPLKQKIEGYSIIRRRENDGAKKGGNSDDLLESKE